MNALKLPSRRRFLSTLGAGLLWGLLPGCRNESAGPLKVCTHVWPGYEFMFLAHREGLLDEKLVHLHEVKSASDTIRELLAGTMDAGALTLDEVLRVRSQGVPLSVVLVFDISAGADVVLGRPGMRSLADIRGKRIGVEDGALGAVMLAELLKAAGLRRDDVQVVSSTIDQHEAAWNNGDVDVVVCYPPVSARIQEGGAVRLFDSRQLPDTIVDVLAVRQDVLKSKGDALRQLITAHFREQKYMLLNPQDANYRMAEHLGIPAQAVQASFTGLVLPNMAYNLRLLDHNPPKLLESARLLSDVMVKEKILPHPDTLGGLLTPDFLPGEEP